MPSRANSPPDSLSSAPSRCTTFITVTWLMDADVSAMNSAAVLRYESSAACDAIHRNAQADSLARDGMPKSSSAHARRRPNSSRKIVRSNVTTPTSVTSVLCADSWTDHFGGMLSRRSESKRSKHLRSTIDAIRRVSAATICSKAPRSSVRNSSP